MPISHQPGQRLCDITSLPSLEGLRFWQNVLFWCLFWHSDMYVLAVEMGAEGAIPVDFGSPGNISPFVNSGEFSGYSLHFFSGFECLLLLGLRYRWSTNCCICFPQLGVGALSLLVFPVHGPFCSPVAQVLLCYLTLSSHMLRKCYSLSRWVGEAGRWEAPALNLSCSGVH